MADLLDGGPWMTSVGKCKGLFGRLQEYRPGGDVNQASATTAPLPQNVWLYGHDVEAEFEQG